MGCQRLEHITWAIPNSVEAFVTLGVKPTRWLWIADEHPCLWCGIVWGVVENNQVRVYPKVVNHGFQTEMIIQMVIWTSRNKPQHHIFGLPHFCIYIAYRVLSLMSTWLFVFVVLGTMWTYQGNHLEVTHQAWFDVEEVWGVYPYYRLSVKMGEASIGIWLGWVCLSC